MPKKYSPGSGGFFDTEVHDTIPSDAVDVSDEAWLQLLEGQSNGQRIVPDETGAPMLQDPEPPEVVPPDPKWVGILFEGIMCSATRDDQSGLVAVLIDWQLSPTTFEPTRFEFANGSQLVLTRENIQRFIAVWKPFRRSFFMPS